MITGIPSGLSFARFDAFGMYTRLTAEGVQVRMLECTRTATSARASEVNATSPSIPAVLRPALRCVTCRTLNSVFDRERSISFCRFLTLGQSPSCVAVKIRCRSRRTLSSWTRQFTESHSRASSSGPFTPRAGIAITTGVDQLYPVIVSNLPFGSGCFGHSSSQAHLPMWARFRARVPRTRYPASYTKWPAEG